LCPIALHAKVMPRRLLLVAAAVFLEMDTDRNGKPDCIDAYPIDALMKIAPDMCSCNKEDEDMDSNDDVDCK